MSQVELNMSINIDNEKHVRAAQAFFTVLAGESVARTVVKEDPIEKIEKKEIKRNPYEDGDSFAKRKEEAEKPVAKSFEEARKLSFTELKEMFPSVKAKGVDSFLEKLVKAELILPEEVPEGEVPEGEVPEGEVPEGEVPEEEVPEGEVPEEEVPEEEVPEEEVPEEEVPEEEEGSGITKADIKEAVVDRSPEHTKSMKKWLKDGGFAKLSALPTGQYAKYMKFLKSLD